MRKKQLLMSVVLGIFMAGSSAQAQMHEGHEHSGPMPTEEQALPTGEESNTGMIEVGNKICPVSGEKVGQMGEVVKAEHNGKIYNLCCAMCKKDFLNDPEKYSAIAEEEVAGDQEDAPSHQDHQHE